MYFVNMLVLKQGFILLSQAQAIYQKNLNKKRVNQKIIGKDNYNIINNKINSGWYQHDSSDKKYFNLNIESISEIEDEKEKEELTKSHSKFFIIELAFLR